MSGGQRYERVSQTPATRNATQMYGVWSPEEATFSFPVTRKNYDELRPSHVAVPRILVVMLVPDKLEDWLNHTERELAIRRCTYWMSLREMPETTNETSVTVAIPRINLFLVDGLRSMMSRIDQGSFP